MCQQPVEDKLASDAPTVETENPCRDGVCEAIADHLPGVTVKNVDCTFNDIQGDQYNDIHGNLTVHNLFGVGASDRRQMVRVLSFSISLSL